eukprot:CAMPEP_0194580498 /NCGR_PEP_ID=MMETSP0292-20121207/14242_1 /TAXON_ID=39354 /ORGANISM="Heterosigma akashiwo, Strain CCMP2393" /LENGTH=121 /DNA_ID=CAMNT_0039433865 /DNA_START=782 /DNA_END=1144 /DNA_ORIENTATION=+
MVSLSQISHFNLATRCLTLVTKLDRREGPGQRGRHAGPHHPQRQPAQAGQHVADLFIFPLGVNIWLTGCSNDVHVKLFCMRQVQAREALQQPQDGQGEGQVRGPQDRLGARGGGGVRERPR